MKKKEKEESSENQVNKTEREWKKKKKKLGKSRCSQERKQVDNGISYKQSSVCLPSVCVCVCV